MAAPGTPSSKANTASNDVKPDGKSVIPSDDRPVCGIIMPISTIGEYEVAHWARVRVVLERSIEMAGYRPRLVSESEAVSVIQAQIVQNIYEDDIVVCDVSAKNPNVMFELGLRLAFDKPVVVVKDDKTDYSFDTSPIKHIPYRHDLRFDDVETLMSEVSTAIKGTMKAAEQTKEFSPFLRYFGKYIPRKIHTEEVDGSTYIIDRMKRIEEMLSNNNNYLRYLMKEARQPETSKQRPINSRQIITSELEYKQLIEAIMSNNTISSKEKEEILESYRNAYEINGASGYK